MLPPAHYHPMLVHFPIALVTVGFLFDFISLFNHKQPCLSKTGFWLQLLGTAGVVAAFASGYLFTNPMEGEAGLIRDKHQIWATASLITIIIATVYRIALNYFSAGRKELTWLSRLINFAAMVLVSYTGYLGGSLVIDYMIGL